REDEVRLRLHLPVEVVRQRGVVERDPGAQEVLLQHRLGRHVRVALDERLDERAARVRSDCGHACTVSAAGAPVDVVARQRRWATKPTQTNHATLPAREAAPCPIVAKTAPAAMTAGIASSVGIHAERQSGRTRNANASTIGASSSAAPVTPDSTLWAVACH